MTGRQTSERAEPDRCRVECRSRSDHVPPSPHARMPFRHPSPSSNVCRQPPVRKSSCCCCCCCAPRHNRTSHFGAERGRDGQDRSRHSICRFPCVRRYTGFHSVQTRLCISLCLSLPPVQLTGHVHSAQYGSDMSLLTGVSAVRVVGVAGVGRTRNRGGPRGGGGGVAVCCFVPSGCLSSSHFLDEAGWEDKTRTRPRQDQDKTSKRRQAVQATSRPSSQWPSPATPGWARLVQLGRHGKGKYVRHRPAACMLQKQVVFLSWSRVGNWTAYGGRGSAWQEGPAFALQGSGQWRGRSRRQTPDDPMMGHDDAWKW